MSFIENCKSPEEWCAVLGARGVKFSERRLRDKARKLGEFLGHAHAMLISEQQMQRILQAEAVCQTKGKSLHTGGESQLSQAANPKDEAREKLERLARSRSKRPR